jgi:hypothetical protein
MLGGLRPTLRPTPSLRTLPMPPSRQVIHIHPAAPAKPPEGAPCNGCGVCCLAEPCPVGMLLSRKRRGACDLLRWSVARQRYLCGLLSAADDGRVPGVWGSVWLSWARRVISAGSGCDANLEVEADRK